MIILKTPQEIEKIREASRIVAKVLRNIEKEIVPGVRTIELDHVAEEMIIKAGAKPVFKGYRGYRFATCISVNDEVVHGIPGEKRLKEGDIVGFDVGVVVDGCIGDGARTFPVSKVSKAALKLIKCAKKALEKAIAQARVSNHLGDISHAIEKQAHGNGYTVVRDLYGHGVGRELHEDPLIPNFGNPGTGPLLRPNMVLAIEPMLNAGGSKIVTLDDGWTVVTEDAGLSAHFENTILITEKGPEILTA